MRRTRPNATLLSRETARSTPRGRRQDLRALRRQRRGFGAASPRATMLAAMQAAQINQSRRQPADGQADGERQRAQGGGGRVGGDRDACSSVEVEKAHVSSAHGVARPPPPPPPPLPPPGLDNSVPRADVLLRRGLACAPLHPPPRPQQEFAHRMRPRRRFTTRGE